MQNLLSTGFIQQTYDDKFDSQELLQQIYNQAPLARIQTKAALLALKKPFFENALETENKFSMASNKAADWNKTDHTNPKDFFNSLKM